MASNAFDLIELGAGDGTKTAVLVDHFLKQSADISYSPIDISQEALDASDRKIQSRIPFAQDGRDERRLFQDPWDRLRTAAAGERSFSFSVRISAILDREQSVAFFRSLRGVMNDERPAVCRL